MTEKRKLIRKTDWIWIVGLLGIAVCLFTVYQFLFQSVGNKCEITVDGEVVKVVELSGDTSFALEQRPAVRFEIHDGAIAFVESDCPDKVCVHTGFLKHSGQMAACLPNLVAIRVYSEQSHADEIDMIAN